MNSKEVVHRVYRMIERGSLGAAIDGWAVISHMRVKLLDREAEKYVGVRLVNCLQWDQACATAPRSDYFRLRFLLLPPFHMDGSEPFSPRRCPRQLPPHPAAGGAGSTITTPRKEGGEVWLLIANAASIWQHSTTIGWRRI